MNTLHKLFLTELADRYDAEKRLVSAMPRMIKAATCAHLQKLIKTHLKETESHVKRLEKVFKAFGEKVRGRKCEATVGLLAEGDDLATDFKTSPAINAALISVAQKVEHYEIASYGCLHEWAGLLGNVEAARILQGILNEEKAANEALIELARTGCNREALGEGCVGAASGHGAKSMKSLNGRRETRPLKIGRVRPASLKI